jgi:hypothetical protein
MGPLAGPFDIERSLQMSQQTLRPAVQGAESIDRLLDQFRTADARAAVLEAELKTIRAQRAAAVAGLRKFRLSYALIGAWVGKSKARIQQINTAYAAGTSRNKRSVAA